MGRIIYLMGKSSTGKDTIYKRLLQEMIPSLQRIVPYTTRPMRSGEQQGVEYFFTDEAGFQKLQQDGKVIEAREYHTMYGLWRYFTADDGQIAPEANYIMIGTPEGFGMLQNYFGREKMLPVLIEVDDGVRLQRALNRERKQQNPKYTEMCRRFLADSEDFAEDKLREVGIGRSFVNENLENCIVEIKQYLSEELAIN